MLVDLGSMPSGIDTRGTTGRDRPHSRPVRYHALMHCSDPNLNQRGQFDRQATRTAFSRANSRAAMASIIEGTYLRGLMR
jgi:hypothetical protein